MPWFFPQQINFHQHWGLNKKKLYRATEYGIILLPRNVSIRHRCPNTPLFCQSYVSKTNIIWTTCASSWKGQECNGQELYKYWINSKANPKVDKYTSSADQHFCKLSGLQVKYFLSYAWTNWKLKIFTKSRAITLTKQNKSTSETPGAQLHMLSIIPAKFHDSRSNTFWATCDTSWKLQIFTVSRAITLKIHVLNTVK
jgi:hypothetical protein